MAIVSTVRPVDLPAGLRVAAGTLTFDSSYPTGGEAVTNAQWGATLAGTPGRAPDAVVLHARATDTGTVDLMHAAWNKATGKLQAYWVDTTADDAPTDEVTDTTSLATFVVDFVAFWFEGTRDVTTI